MPLTPLQEQSARELSAAGVDGGTEFDLARAHQPARIRAVIRRARRQGYRGGWIRTALLKGWEGDPEPGSEHEKSEESDVEMWGEEHLTEEERAYRRLSGARKAIRNYGREQAKRMDPPMMKTPYGIRQMTREEWERRLDEVSDEEARGRRAEPAEPELSAGMVAEGVAMLSGRLGWSS